MVHAPAPPLRPVADAKSRDMKRDMKKDWDGTLKAMKDYGYSYIDLNQVSPYTDRPAAELKASFASHGFTFSNALWSYQAFANEFDKTIR